jgi:hypothetical protein
LQSIVSLSPIIVSLSPPATYSNFKAYQTRLVKMMLGYAAVAISLLASTALNAPTSAGPSDVVRRSVEWIGREEAAPVAPAKVEERTAVNATRTTVEDTPAVNVTRAKVEHSGKYIRKFSYLPTCVPIYIYVMLILIVVAGSNLTAEFK